MSPTKVLNAFLRSSGVPGCEWGWEQTSLTWSIRRVHSEVGRHSRSEEAEWLSMSVMVTVGRLVSERLASLVAGAILSLLLSCFFILSSPFAIFVCLSNVSPPARVEKKTSNTLLRGTWRRSGEKSADWRDY